MNHKEIPESTREKEPKISYEILYSAHDTAKDFKKLAEVFPKCDIYVPEGIDWTPKFLADFQALSQGKMTPQELMEKYGGPKNSAVAKEYKVIYQSQKPILFADLGEGHKVEEIYSQSNALYAQSFKKFRDGNFPMALQKMREFAAKSAEFHQKREEIIKVNLETRIKELIENNPQFKNKKEIKVLLSLGACHTRFFHSLKQEKPSTARQFANLPLVFINEEEAARRIMFSKELKDELLAKIFIENFLNRHFNRITDDSDKMARVVRKISSKISLDEIKKLSENWTEKDVIMSHIGFLPPTLINFLNNKGIKIPESEREMDEMLKNKQ